MACMRAFIFTSFKAVMLNEIHEFEEIDGYKGLPNKRSKEWQARQCKGNEQCNFDDDRDGRVLFSDVVGIAKLLWNGTYQVTVNAAPPW